MPHPFPIVKTLALAASLALATSPALAARVQIQFPGAKAFSQEQLFVPISEQITEIETKGLTPARADDAAFFLAAYYRKQGYSRADVKYEIRGNTLVFRIAEGPRAVLRSLEFRGNKSLTSEELALYFAGVSAKEIAGQSIAYDEAEVTAGEDRVRGYYLSLGWLDAAVNSDASKLAEDGTGAAIILTITEGTRYTFGATTFEGSGKYSRAELIEALGAKPKGPFTPAVVGAMEGALRSWLRGRGHFTAQVTAVWKKEDAKAGRVPVQFVISSGPTFRISRIETKGLNRVTPEFIERRFGKITGATYEPAKIDEKYRELLRTGLFRTFRVVPKEDGPARLKLEVEVEETKQKEFGVELGYGTYDGITAGIRLADRNFLRYGRPLSLSLETSQRGFEGELLYVDPWFLESEWTLRARLYSQFRDEEGYSKTGVGLRVDASRKVTSRWELSAFTEFAAAKVTSEEIDPLLLGPLDYTLMSLGIASKLDYRDDPLNPRRGFVFTSSVELDALDGQLAFGRVTGRYSHYRSIGKTLLAAGARFGWIIPVGEAADIPIDLRYFNGGGNSVRSYAERDLGPRSAGGHPLGGAFYTVANVEWDFPLTSTLEGAVFIDAGNLVAAAEPGFEDMRFAIGLGLRYQLPIGPMRLDYGYNPAPKPGDDRGAVHFSFGFAF